MKQLNQQRKLIILVEGSTDKIIVEHLLNALRNNAIENIEIKVCQGKKNVRQEYIWQKEKGLNQVALIDADAPTTPDGEEAARQFFGTSEKNIFCAVPAIEAWVFADKELAQKNARQSAYAKSVFSRLVTSESLMNPKHLVNQVFDRRIIRENYPFLEHINIGRAVASSASMFRFLRGIDAAIGNEWTMAERQLSNSLNRKVFANLLREIPGQTIGWKTLDGEFTAEQLGDLILKGDDLGLRYVTELLRLSRDILAARSRIESGSGSDA